MKFKLNSLVKKPSDRELIRLWREVGLLKAYNKCEYPGCFKTEYLNAHHFFSRSRRSTRYDPDNCIILCPGHHSLGNDSAHKSPFFKDVILSNGVRTYKWLEILTRRANTPAKLDTNLVKLDLLQQLKLYEKGNSKM